MLFKSKYRGVHNVTENIVLLDFGFSIMNKISRKLIERDSGEKGVIIEEDDTLRCYRVVRLDNGEEELWFKDNIFFTADVIDAQREQRKNRVALLLRLMSGVFAVTCVAIYFAPYEPGRIVIPFIALLSVITMSGSFLPSETENKI